MAGLMPPGQPGPSDRAQGGAMASAPGGAAAGPVGVAADAPGATEQGPEPNVTPEEQAQYERVVDNALSLIYDKKVFPTVLEQIRSAPDPATGIAAVTAQIGLRIEQSAQQSGEQLADGVLLHAGAEIVADLAETAEQAGAGTFSEEEVERIYFLAVDLFRSMKQESGGIDQGAAAAELEQTMASGQGAELAQVLARAGLPMPGQEAEQPAPAGQEEPPRRGLLDGAAAGQGG